MLFFSNIILDNIFRSIHLNSVQRGQLNYLRYLFFIKISFSFFLYFDSNHIVCFGCSYKKFICKKIFRYDRDEAISGILKKGDYLNQPLVVRSEPHLVIQSPQQLKPWVLQDELSSLELVFWSFFDICIYIFYNYCNS